MDDNTVFRGTSAAMSFQAFRPRIRQAPVPHSECDILVVRSVVFAAYTAHTRDV